MSKNMSKIFQNVDFLVLEAGIYLSTVLAEKLLMFLCSTYDTPI